MNTLAVDVQSKDIVNDRDTRYVDWKILGIITFISKGKVIDWI